ncbi:hypothetical protein [Thermomonospora umbrina]|nr:hypothetical protein [Thermomonospora umbrina]
MTTRRTPTATCTRCRATLRSPRSVARRMGDRCARLTRQDDAVKDAKAAAIDKARQLIADRAILPLRGRRVFQVVASDGNGRYLTAPQGCTCTAGIKGRHRCYHRVAAAMLAA